MDLSNLKSLEQATDRQILLLIVSTQLQLARKIEFLENKISKTELDSVENLADEIIDKSQAFLEHIERALEDR